jgi:hypothetical protein
MQVMTWELYDNDLYAGLSGVFHCRHTICIARNESYSI